jgi:enterochelin esterase family protein
MKYLFASTLMWLLSSAGVRGQSFAQFLSYLNNLPQAERQAVADSFMTANPQLPYLEGDTLAVYIYKGNAQSVTVPGDANNWNQSSDGMSHLAGTDFWYRQEVYESDARLDYKFVLNNSSWILDPHNPHTCTGGFGPNSELRMPQYVPPPETAYYDTLPHGSLFDTVFNSTWLGNSRVVKVYLPGDYSTGNDSYPIMLFHDGLEYLSLANAKNVLDYAIGTKEIEPLIAIFVPPVNRTAEYAGDLSDEFAHFIVDEVMAWAVTRFRIEADPQRHATGGASYGANISLYLGLNHPEVFGCVAAWSAYVDPAISSAFQNGPVLDLRIVLDVGTYDITELIPMVRDFRDILLQKQYPLDYHEYHEGHSWGNWKAHIDDALQFFFPLTGDVPGHVHDKRTCDLQIFPNPSAGQATARISVPAGEPFTLRLSGLGGSPLQTLNRGVSNGNPAEVRFDLAGYPAGCYLLELESGGKKTVRTLVVR